MQAAENVPEERQLVDLRPRRNVVTEVTRTTPPTEVIRSDNSHQHLVSHASAEDDALRIATLLSQDTG